MTSTAVDKRWVYGSFTANLYDVVRCAPDTLGEDTACTTLDLSWLGADYAFASSKNKIDGLMFGQASYPLPTVCYALDLGHTGWGTDPVATPVKSDDCDADGRYVAGEVIQLSGAVPNNDWVISGWSGTDDDAATAASNQLTMPAASHAAAVHYEYAHPLYLSPTGRVTVNTVRYEDEDILEYNPADGWLPYFDGSAVGLTTADVNAFYLEEEGTILMTLDKPLRNLPGLDGVLVDDSDVLRFTPTALGKDTDGSFELYFDGSDVEPTTANEDIDAISLAGNGDLLISTVGTVRWEACPQ
ncbi:MAG: hypothetical protein R3C44_15760 [Chloroflexota bacterium]